MQKNNQFKSFSQYRTILEAQSPVAVGAHVTLDGEKFPPFIVSDDPKSQFNGKNKNLAPIVRAFKNGGNWGFTSDDTGEKKPVKISGKKLYLAGGAVRDHLLGKKPRDIELVTNATSDEIYHILKQNGFEYLPNKTTATNRAQPSFSPETLSKDGKPVTFALNVGGEEFSLSIFKKTPRGIETPDMETGSHVDDANGRDFTINSMYILLSNDNGPNKDLTDFFGGLHHLNQGRIATIGKAKQKFEEEPSRLMRYARMLTGYGKLDTISDEERSELQSLAKLVKNLKRKTIVDEFQKGIERDDVDPRYYLDCLHSLGLSSHVFPGKIIDSNLPSQLTGLSDQYMPVAYMLRLNPANTLNDLDLNGDVNKKINFLVKSLGLKDDLDEDHLSDLVTSYLHSGISSRGLRDFAVKAGRLDQTLVDRFLDFLKHPRVVAYAAGNLTEPFKDLADPVTGEYDPAMVEHRRRRLELENYRSF